jgi:acyl-CoA reductase-like NAD-dependent aldehyde dehydrogenase
VISIRIRQIVATGAVGGKAPAYARPVSLRILVGGRLRPASGRSDVTAAAGAARAALAGWSGMAARDRGRALYEVAQLLDERRDRLVTDSSRADVDAAVDRWLWYAGWADKVAAVLGSVNPVAGPAVSWSSPRPVGVVGALARPAVYGIVDVLAPVLAVGATAVVIVPDEARQPAAALGELLAVSGLPAGVANLLLGPIDDQAPELARAGIDGLDLAGAPAAGAAELARAAAERLLPVLPPSVERDGLAPLRAWTRAATVWHPVGR